jgi:hypothetical protein
MTDTNTSAYSRSSDTFTRVMLTIVGSRGSFSSRWMNSASSRWIVLPSISVRLDIALCCLPAARHLSKPNLSDRRDARPWSRTTFEALIWGDRL